MRIMKFECSRQVLPQIRRWDERHLGTDRFTRDSTGIKKAGAGGGEAEKQEGEEQ